MCICPALCLHSYFSTSLVQQIPQRLAPMAGFSYGSLVTGIWKKVFLETRETSESFASQPPDIGSVASPELRYRRPCSLPYPVLVPARPCDTTVTFACKQETQKRNNTCGDPRGGSRRRYRMHGCVCHRCVFLCENTTCVCMSNSSSGILVSGVPGPPIVSSDLLSRRLSKELYLPTLLIRVQKTTT